MKNTIKEIQGLEKNYFIRILNNIDNETKKDYETVKSLRENFNEKIEEIFFLIRQTNFLNSESLELNEEITRLTNELETKQLDERYR